MTVRMFNPSYTRWVASACTVVLLITSGIESTATNLDREITPVFAALPKLLPPVYSRNAWRVYIHLVTEHVHLDPVPLLGLCHERILLGKVVERVDDDEGWLSGGVGAILESMSMANEGPIGGSQMGQGEVVEVDRSEGLWRGWVLEGAKHEGRHRGGGGLCVLPFDRVPIVDLGSFQQSG